VRHYGPAWMHVQTACVWEALARKVGNVHPTAPFADVECATFLLSGAAIAPTFHNLEDFLNLGDITLAAVEDTRAWFDANANLGIILALAPLAAIPLHVDLRRHIQQHLGRTTVHDAKQVYRAIRLANPGGLGEASEQDVRSEPTVTLLEAMKLAADRDLIARQYANGFADVFEFGVPALLEGFEQFGSVEAAIVHSQLRWLAAYPDSLIARKNGLVVAEDVQKRAAEVVRLGGIATPEGSRAGVALDKHLRSDGNKLNPGTTADLTAACLFVALRENKLSPSAPFTWKTDEWLT